MTSGTLARVRAAVDRPGVWEALVALTAAALYARTVGFGWVYDDQMEIVRNPLVHSLRHFPTLFTTTAWAGSGMETYLYRPVTMASYALNSLVSGLGPWSYHLVNVVLHAGVSVLVFRLGRLWKLTTTTAGIGALLFAVHPVHVEAAAAVFGRRDLLAAGFLLLMALSHRSALAQGGLRAATPVVAFLLAMLSKEVGVVGLFLVAVQDVLLEARPARLAHDRRAVGLYFAYTLALLAYLLVRAAVTGGIGVPETSFYDNPLVDAPTVQRWLTALLVIGKGAGLLAAPITLSPDYSYDAIPLARTAADWRFLATAAGLILLGVGLARRDLRRTVLPLATAWYAVSLLPTANLLITTGTIFGERLLYLPSVALCLAAGAAVTWVARRRPAGGAVLATALLVSLSVQTWRYSTAWDNDLALFTWAVEAVPRSTRAHHKLGEELARAGRYGDAVRSLRRALEVAPGNPYTTDLRSQLKRVLSQQDVTSSASMAAPPTDPDVLYLLGEASWDRRDTATAARYWLSVLHADPTHTHALIDLASLRLLQGDTARAVRRLEEAVAIDPTLARGWFALGRIRLAQGRTAAGLEALRRFLAHAGPRYPDQVAWARQVVEGPATTGR